VRQESSNHIVLKEKTTSKEASISCMHHKGFGRGRCVTSYSRQTSPSRDLRILSWNWIS